MKEKFDWTISLGKWLLLASVALMILGALMLRVHGSFYISPDETAVQFFAVQFARTGHLYASDPLNVALGNVLHPRSVLSVNGRLVPASFFGLSVITGTMAAFVGTWSIPFFPIALSALAVFAWAAICRNLFGTRIGWLAGILLALQPAWWFYTARSLMPNVAFLSCLIFAAFFLIVRPLGRSAGSQNAKFSVGDIFRNPACAPALLSSCAPLFAGLCFGAALFIRLSEAAWAGIIFLVIVWWKRRALGWRGIVMFVLGTILALAPMFAFQKVLYGSWLANGYTAELASPSASSSIGSIATSAPPGWLAMERVVAPLFPFGVHPALAWQQFVSFGLNLFPWTCLFALCGILVIAWRVAKREPGSRRPLGFLALAVFISTWLILMYGSWVFHDNPNPLEMTIGDSHVRYWLPIFLLATPLIAIAFDALLEKISTRWRLPLLGVLLVAWLAIGVQAAFFAPQDGLIAEAAVLGQTRAVHDAVINLTEPNAVIIVDRDDKIFFPDRQVLYPLRDPHTYAMLPKIAALAPLYYYGITLPAADLNYLNDHKLTSSDLMFEPVQSFGIETLYRIKVVGG